MSRGRYTGSAQGTPRGTARRPVRQCGGREARLRRPADRRRPPRPRSPRHRRATPPGPSVSLLCAGGQIPMLAVPVRDVVDVVECGVEGDVGVHVLTARIVDRAVGEGEIGPADRSTRGTARGVPRVLSAQGPRGRPRACGAPSRARRTAGSARARGGGARRPAWCPSERASWPRPAHPRFRGSPTARRRR